MFIKYICSNPGCKSTRVFSSVKSEKVICDKCNSEMLLEKNNVTSEVFTTPEARYLGDEALFNTVGKRISNKHTAKHL